VKRENARHSNLLLTQLFGMVKFRGIGWTNGLGKSNQLGSCKQLDRRASFCHTEYIRQRRKIMDEQADDNSESSGESTDDDELPLKGCHTQRMD